MTKEGLEKLISEIKDTIGEENSALVSENLLSIVADKVTALEELEKNKKEIENLKKRNEEL